jgi:hypothetical protein
MGKSARQVIRLQGYTLDTELPLLCYVMLCYVIYSALAYRSMVVYLTKASDAKRVLEGQYFDIAGESAYTRVFEPRTGPNQCYNC